MSQKQQPIQYTSHGVDVNCPICKNDTFTSGRAQLNTALATFFKFDWANKEVQTLTCSKCKYILWFDDDEDLPS